MTTRKYSSRAQQTTLSSGITSGDVTMTVGSGANLMGGKTPAVGETYTVVIDPDTALEEIVDVSNYASGNTLTIARGIDGSTGVAHSAGAIVRHMVIGRDLSESNTHIEATTGHGATGAVVGTTNTQTLTNKTIDTASNTITGAVTLTGTQTLTNKTLTSPTFTTPALGTPASGVLTNATGLPLTTGVTGTLPVANGGTGVTSSTGSGNTVLSTSPTLVTPVLGTPTSATLTNATGLPISTGVAGLGTGVATFLATPSSANLASALTDETGSGAAVFATSPTLVTPVLGVATATSINGTTIPSSATLVKTSDTGTVTSTMLLDGTILNADVNASAAIDYSKLNLNGTITSADIVDGTIVNADINASAAIDWTKLGISSTVSSTEIGYVDGVTSAIQTQLDAKLALAGGTMSGAIAMGTSKITGMGDPTLAQDAATKAYVDLQRDNLINSAPGIYDTLGEIATAIQSGGTFYDSLVLKSGSTMTGALTLSGAPTVDLHAATKLYVDGVAGSATAAAASAAAAAASYDSFDDRYLGAFASAPTLDNDGNSLQTGALYWNSVSAIMLAWSGSAWSSISSSAAIYRYKFIAAGGETSLSGADASSQTLAYIAGNEQVYLNGVLLVRTTDYTATNGTSITALSALVLNDIVEIITFTALSVVTDIPQSIVDVKGDLIVGTAADTVGRLAVGTNGQVLTADSTAGTGLAYTTPISASSTTTFTNKTLTAPIISSISNTGTLTLPTSTDTLVGKATTDTLTNKTFDTAGTGNSFSINGTAITANTGTGSNVLSASPTFTGTVTGTPAAGTTSTATTGFGYMGLPQNATTTGSATVAAADAGKHIYSTATRTITIDSNANLALPIGTAITFIATTGATVTIAITTDTMYLAGAGTTGSRTLAAHGMATAVKVASTTWYISGNGLT